MVVSLSREVSRPARGILYPLIPRMMMVVAIDIELLARVREARVSYNRYI